MKYATMVVAVVVLVGCTQETSQYKASVAGVTDNFLSEKARAELSLPAEDELTLPTDADLQYAKTIDPTVQDTVKEFLRPRAVEWRIVAARPVGSHLLLWVSFPKIADGGIDLIYSVEKKRIVGEFLGGYRG